jgi:hypothetical protein
VVVAGESPSYAERGGIFVDSQDSAV